MKILTIVRQVSAVRGAAFQCNPSVQVDEEDGITTQDGSPQKRHLLETRGYH